jgi:hypothetical protein
VFDSCAGDTHCDSVTVPFPKQPPSAYPRQMSDDSARIHRLEPKGNWAHWTRSVRAILHGRNPKLYKYIDTAPNNNDEGEIQQDEGARHLIFTSDRNYPTTLQTQRVQMPREKPSNKSSTRHEGFARLSLQLRYADLVSTTMNTIFTTSLILAEKLEQTRSTGGYYRSSAICDRQRGRISNLLKMCGHSVQRMWISAWWQVRCTCKLRKEPLRSTYYTQHTMQTCEVQRYVEHESTIIYSWCSLIFTARKTLNTTVLALCSGCDRRPLGRRRWHRQQRRRSV